MTDVRAICVLLQRWVLPGLSDCIAASPDVQAGEQAEQLSTSDLGFLVNTSRLTKCKCCRERFAGLGEGGGDTSKIVSGTNRAGRKEFDRST